MTTYSPVKHQENNYIIPITSTTKHNAQRIGDISARLLNLHTTAKLLQWVKNIFFQNDSKSSQSTKCVKSRIMTMVIDYFLSIDIFEQQYVVIKGILQSPRLKYYVKTIGIYQSLSNNVIFEHKCLQNTENDKNMRVSVTTNNN